MISNSEDKRTSADAAAASWFPDTTDMTDDGSLGTHLADSTPGPDMLNRSFRAFSANCLLLSASRGSDPGNSTVTVFGEEAESVLRGFGFLHRRHLINAAKTMFDRTVTIG